MLCPAHLKSFYVSHVHLHFSINSFHSASVGILQLPPSLALTTSLFKGITEGLVSIRQSASIRAIDEHLPLHQKEKSYDDKGRSRGDSGILRREKDQLQTAPGGTRDKRMDVL